MYPLPPVVRSTVASWQTTRCPSAVAWTSSSSAEAPAARARRMAQSVLEGPSRAPPWWAKARTRRSSQGFRPTVRRYRGPLMDHALLEAIAALRHAFEDALLERQAAVDERFQVDILGGDMSFETSYCLPGEGATPRVRADIGLEWPTWSQAAYRSWAIGEGFDEPPELILEVTLRLQRLVAPPDPRVALGLLPEEIHALGSGCDTLERADPSVEQVFGKPPEVAECSLEVT